MSRKINIITNIIFLLLLMLFLFSGCSPESVETAAEDTQVESVESVTEEQNNNDNSDVAEENDQEIPLTSESSVETSEGTEETYNEGISAGDNPSVLRYKEIKVEIAQLYTVYAELHTSTISLNIDTETGLIDGYILLGYDDIRPVEDGRVECASTLKGAISGFYDADSGEFTAGIIGEVNAEGGLCFSGEIDQTLTLNSLEEGEYIEGSFKVPILTQFDFLLQKANQ